MKYKVWIWGGFLTIILLNGNGCAVTKKNDDAEKNAYRAALKEQHDILEEAKGKLHDIDDKLYDGNSRALQDGEQMLEGLGKTVFSDCNEEYMKNISGEIREHKALMEKESSALGKITGSLTKLTEMNLKLCRDIEKTKGVTKDFAEYVKGVAQETKRNIDELAIASLRIDTAVLRRGRIIKKIKLLKENLDFYVFNKDTGIIYFEDCVFRFEDFENSVNGTNEQLKILNAVGVIQKKYHQIEGDSSFFGLKLSIVVVGFGFADPNLPEGNCLNNILAVAGPLKLCENLYSNDWVNTSAVKKSDVNVCLSNLRAYFTIAEVRKLLERELKGQNIGICVQGKGTSVPIDVRGGTFEEHRMVRLFFYVVGE